MKVNVYLHEHDKKNFYFEKLLFKKIISFFFKIRVSLNI